MGDFLSFHWAGLGKRQPSKSSPIEDSGEKILPGEATGMIRTHSLSLCSRVFNHQDTCHFTDSHSHEPFLSLTLVSVVPSSL